jgi:hypothetical protein
MLCKFASVLLFGAIVASAAPVATVTSSGAFKLGRVDVQATAAAGVPVNVGDVVTTLQSPAIVRFDKGVIMLDANSSVRIETKDDHTIVRLLSGSMQYKLTEGSDIQIYNRTHAAGPGLEGKIAASGIGKTVPIVVGAAAAGAGVGAGVALTRSSPLSGSK